MESLIAFFKQQQLPYTEQLPLDAHSSFHIGGRARLALYPQSAVQLVQALRFLHRKSVPFAVLGMASNVLFSDDGYDGVLVFTVGCRQMRVEETSVFCEAGVLLKSAANAALEHALEGLEFAHGIPGTVGGALFMNAGAYGGCMKDVCVRSYAYDCVRDAVLTLEGEAQAFGTRESIYTAHPEYTALGAELVLKKGERQCIAARMEAFRERRRLSQPLEYPSAGSIFKRPAGHFAGKLVEDCGWKGRFVGGAQVSEKHAGFIVNRGGATAADVRSLIADIRADVLQKTGVALECEVRYIGTDGADL